MQLGPGPQLAAQCVRPPPAPTGWRPWLLEVDGPIPEPLEARAAALLSDPQVELGATESFPIPGVIALIRVEPRVWSRGDGNALTQGCFKATAVYLPQFASETVTSPTPPNDNRLEKAIGVFTVISLVIGTAATVATWGK